MSIRWRPTAAGTAGGGAPGAADSNRMCRREVRSGILGQRRATLESDQGVVNKLRVPFFCLFDRRRPAPPVQSILPTCEARERPRFPSRTAGPSSFRSKHNYVEVGAFKD